jgi:23S rRNA pseudouridine1911/1915/1917 synthase
VVNESQVVRHLKVPPSATGQRLDRWLTDQFEGESRSAVQRWIAEGLVTVNGERPSKAGMSLEAEAEIEVVQRPAVVETALLPEDIPLDIIYQDNNLLVIDKPAGLVVHPGPGHAAGTLANAILHHCPGLAGIGGEKRPGIVHRLDKGTSGLIVVAKNDAAMRFLQEQFAGRTVYKEYLALLEGRIEPSRGRIDAPIGRHPTRRQRMAVLPAAAGLTRQGMGSEVTAKTFTPAARGRAAVTDYECLRVYEDQTSGQTMRFSLVRAILHTGRTHQIRAHFAWRNNPVAGDTEYGYKRSRLSLARPFLHAHRLGIRLPGSGEERVFKSPLPAELQRIVERLEE